MDGLPVLGDSHRDRCLQNGRSDAMILVVPFSKGSFSPLVGQSLSTPNPKAWDPHVAVLAPHKAFQHLRVSNDSQGHLTNFDIVNRHNGPQRETQVISFPFYGTLEFTISQRNRHLQVQQT